MTRPVLMIGHFPPPVHGMAVAFDALADEVATVAPVVRVPTSPDRFDASAGYHLARLRRVAAALLLLARSRRRSHTVVFSSDAGRGMVYLLVLLAVARLLRYACVVQHHSYAYLDRRSRAMALAVRVGGPCLHVCSCPEMSRAFREQYPHARRVRTVGMAYALTTASPGNPRTLGTDRPVVLGHFGNLTLAKGLADAIGTLEQLRADGVECRLELAGPLLGDAERALVAAAAGQHPGRVAHRGPVYGGDRDAFLADVDVLLFPSRYPHESFGLVVWEALAAGVPAIAYRAGCLTAARAGRGAVVLDAEEPFVERAARTVTAWADDPEQYAVAARTAARDVAAAVIRGRRDARTLAADLTAGTARKGTR